MNTAESTSRRSKLELGGWLVVLLSTATVVSTTCVLPNDIQSTIELNLSADSVFVGLGSSASAPVEVLAGGAAYNGVQILLQSGDPSIVAVDTAGALTGVRRGAAAIEVQLVSSASGGGTLPSAQFTAKAVAASLDVVPQSTDTITALGDSVRFVPVLRDNNGNAVDDTVSCMWYVSDSTLVSVNSAGWVTAHRAGQATLTATAPWDGKSGSHAVTVVQEVSAVAVYPANADTLTSIGDTASFVARATDRNDSTVAAAAFTWHSDDEAVATVSGVDAVTALVTAQGRGSAEITASASRLPQSADSVRGRDTLAVWQVPQRALLSGPDSQPGNAVGGPFMLTAADANGHPTPVNVATVFDLSTTSPDGAFYFDAAGSTPASTVTIAADDSTVSFYCKDIRPGPQTITATWISGDGIGDATHSVTIVTVAVSGAVTPAGVSIAGVGTTSQLVIEARDGNGFVIPSPDATWVSLNSNVATVDATGLTTAVASGQVTIRAQVDAVSAYALVTVTDAAATALNLWAPKTSGTSESLRNVWGASSSDVFVVGANGTVLRYNGSSWSAVASGTTQGLNAVWGTSSSDLYVVGTSGTILHYDGTGFSAGTSGTNEHLIGVWGSSPSDVYGVGEAGTILHYDGITWSAVTSGTTESLHGVWGTSSSDVYAVGSGGTILHWDGSSWSAQSSGTSADLQVVWGSSASQVYAVGALGIILHFDGSSWSADASGTTEDLQSVWGTNSSDVFAVGTAGAITRYDGTDWSQMSSGVTESLFGVWGTSSGGGFAVGASGTILHGYRGATVSVTPAAPPTLVSINETVQLSAAARDASASPVGGVTFTWSSDDETVATVNATGLVTAVANGTATITATAPGGASGTATITVAQEVATVAVSPPAASVSGVGNTLQLTVEARDAGGRVIPSPSLSVTWTSLNTYVATINPTNGLATMAASGQVTIEAEVDGILRYALLTVSDPALAPVTIWNMVESGATEGVGAGWAASPTDVYALGSGGLFHYDGTTWTSLPTSLTDFTMDVWGTSPGDVYMVGYEFAGDQGTILHYDGANWTSMASGTSEILLGVWGSSPTDIFAVGENGTIVHYDGTSWNPMTSGTANRLSAVWGLSPIDVYAVGGRWAEEGTVLHYDGTSWTPMSNDAVSELWEVWGTSESSIYATEGLFTHVLRYDGASWSSFVPTNSIKTYGLWGSSDADLYVTGCDSLDLVTIQRYDGSSWHVTSYPTSCGIRTEVFGVPSGDLFYGVPGAILRGYRGATVSVTPDNHRLNAITETVQLSAQAEDRDGNPIASVPFTWSVDNQAVVTVDQNGLVTATGTGSARVTTVAPGGAADTVTVRVIPAADSVEVSPIGTSISGVGTTQQFTVQAWDASGQPIASPAVVWTSLNANVATIHPTTGLATAKESGQTTISATADGITEYALLTITVPSVTPVNLWSEMMRGDEGSFLLGVWGTSATDAYAVGALGPVLHYNGTSWNSIGGSYAGAVWGTSATDVYVLSWGGEVLHYNGTDWSTTRSLDGTSLQSVWGASPTDVYAVGAAGLIVHYDGTTWSAMASGTVDDLRGTWGTSSKDVYAVGSGGTILHFNGTNWSPMVSGTSADIVSVWGTSGTDIYVVGEYWADTTLHYDGSSWIGMPSGTIHRPAAVWGTSATDIYVVGFAGAMQHYDGTSWSAMPSGTGGTLYGVWGTSAGDVFAVGEAEVILRGVRGASVVVTPDDHTLTALGGTVQLTAEARDAANNPISGVTFTWSSSVQSVATVDTTGLVTAVGSGATTITATATGPGGVTGTATVRVIPADELDLSETTPFDYRRRKL